MLYILHDVVSDHYPATKSLGLSVEKNGSLGQETKTTAGIKTAAIM